MVFDRGFNKAPRSQEYYNNYPTRSPAIIKIPLFERSFAFCSFVAHQYINEVLQRSGGRQDPLPTSCTPRHLRSHPPPSSVLGQSSEVDALLSPYSYFESLDEIDPFSFRPIDSHSPIRSLFTRTFTIKNNGRVAGPGGPAHGATSAAFKLDPYGSSSEVAASQ